MNYLKNYFSGYHKQGGIKELLIIALPMVISTACDGVMTFTDRLFLSRIGYEQMNAALGGGVAMQMLMFFFVGLTGYSTALVAQYYGANEKHNSSKAIFQALIISVLAYPIILLLKPLVIYSFTAFNTPVSQLSHQVEYLNILAWGGLFSLLRFTMGCFFSGIGKTKIVMVATIAAMLTNVFLDYVLIFGKFGFEPMGIKGAAYATVTGSLVATFILVFSYFQPKNIKEFFVLKSLHFDKVILKKLIYYGSPAGIEMFLNFLAFSTMIFMFQSQGDVVSTATTIMFNWDLVSFIPLLGIEIAVTSLVGRYMGAGLPGIAQKTTFSGIKSGIFYSIIILILFIFIPEYLVRVFSPENPSLVFEQAVPIAVSMIRIATLYVLAEAIMVAIIGALRGAGDTYFTMFASVLSHWTLIPLLYLSFFVLNFSAVISWFIMVIVFLIFCLVLILRFKSGKWKKISVIK